jgi:type VI protein secretion system component Hcp
MAEDNRDILMMMELTDGTYVPAECTAVVSPMDKLATGFSGTPYLGGLVQGNYFAVEDFTMEVSISDSTDKKDSMELQDDNTRSQVEDLGKQVGKSIGTLHDYVNELQGRIAELEAMVSKLTGSSGSRGRSAPIGTDPSATKFKSGEKASVPYRRFMTSGRDALRSQGDRYPSDLESVTISRRMDRSSPTLFDKCRSSFKFNSATILKRKAIGADTLRGFLRIDFYDVMLTDLNWDHDEQIKEKLKFVCRRADVTYAVETMGGGAKKGSNLLTKQPVASWSMRAKP